MASDNSNLVEKLVFVNKVSKVVRGGKNFSFSALVVVGDKNGKVGYGKGKAREVVDAKNKAFERAKKSMIKIPLKESRTIHHDLKGSFGPSNVIIRSCPSGTGVIAGGAMRAVFESLGIHDVVAKSFGSSNPYNIIAATFATFKKYCPPKLIAESRGKEINEIVRKRNFLTSADKQENNLQNSKVENKTKDLKGKKI